MIAPVFGTAADHLLWLDLLRSCSPRGSDVPPRTRTLSADVAYLSPKSVRSLYERRAHLLRQHGHLVRPQAIALVGGTACSDCAETAVALARL